MKPNEAILKQQKLNELWAKIVFFEASVKCYSRIDSDQQYKAVKPAIKSSGTFASKQESREGEELTKKKRIGL